MISRLRKSLVPDGSFTAQVYQEYDDDLEEEQATFEEIFQPQYRFTRLLGWLVIGTTLVAIAAVAVATQIIMQRQHLPVALVPSGGHQSGIRAAISPGGAIAEMTDELYMSELAAFVRAVRSNFSDYTVHQEMSKWAGNHILRDSQADRYINEWFFQDAAGSAARAGRGETVHVDVLNISRAAHEGRTFVLTWRESVFSREQQKLDTYIMRGYFAVDQRAVVDPQPAFILSNPLRWFVTDCRWERDITAKGGDA